MKKSHCRISRVIPKNAPNVIEIVPNIRGVDAERAHRSIDEIEQYFERGIAGIAIVAWNFNGETWSSALIDRDSFVGNMYLPDYVASILRYRIMEKAAESVVNGDVD